MVKRKAADTQSEANHTDKKVKNNSVLNPNVPARADQIGLKFTDFQKTGPHLSFNLSEKKSGQEAEEILKMQLVKNKMSTGSFGWTGAGKKIAVQVEVDGKKQLVYAQISVNVTIAGSESAEQDKGVEGDDSA